MHDTVIYGILEFTGHYLILRVFFAPETAHGCMICVNGEYLFSTLIADCSIVLIHDLSQVESASKTNFPSLALINLRIQKWKRHEAFRFGKRVY